MNLHLRAARNDDGPAVERLVFGVLAEHGLVADPDGTDTDLRNLETFYFGGFFDVLVNEGEEIVGSVGLRRISASECELRKMYLAPHARGFGWGRRLLDHALHRARTLGFSRVTLETAAALRDAITLYERNGFRRYTPEHPMAPRCDATYCREL
ncbi:MAG TPA: GNAT family N-acetyltransferase [Candidatus Acidoferrum sp.]|nr:GNAT family N-acetyltransferase [Candidatus Acidoferrum sp.]